MIPQILAMYLPQFHQIPENNEFWGEGFTDWVTVQNAKPLYDKHQQPRTPLGNNYYDLSEEKNILWQAKLAKQYGVEGFGIYHYWFNNYKNLLTKPAEIVLHNHDIDIKFFFAWDNISWRRTWSNVSGNDWAPTRDSNIDKTQYNNGILLEYKPGTETDWKKHFDYLLPFFKDERYIKIDGKPVFFIFHYSEVIHKMCQYWNKIATEHGLEGITPVFRQAVNLNIPRKEQMFMYEPSASSWDLLPYKIYRRILRQFNISCGPHFFDYDKVWQRLLKNMSKRKDYNLWLSGFVGYDDTPRRAKKGTVIKNATPEKFEQYLTSLLQIAKKQNKQYVLLVAWNEWSEGAYLEPDTINEYRYLEALKNALQNVTN